jgi:hypothetical protein
LLQAKAPAYCLKNGRLGSALVDTFVNIVFWMHFIGLAMGLGGGIALGFVGPKLIAAEGPMLEEMWRFFGRVGVWLSLSSRAV